MTEFTGQRSAAAALRAFCAGWDALDATAIAAPFASDGRFEDPLQPCALIGRDEIAERLAVSVAGLEDCRVELGHVLESDGVGLCEGVFSAQARDGEVMRFPFAMVVELRDGLIVRLSEYFDSGSLERA